MKMIHKLILLFSLLATLTTAANSIYFTRTQMAELDQRTYDTLTTTSARIVGEIEQYVRLMDYAIDSLTSNPAFMEDFYTASLLTENDTQAQALLSRLSQSMYQEPILEPFFRVTAYSTNGFFVTSRFEKRSDVALLSDEAREVIDSLTYYRDLCDAQPHVRHIISPHNDPWTEEFVGVFSAVRTLTWQGQPIGYVEVNAHLDDLAEMFLWNQQEGILVQGIFDSGEQLFRNQGDDIIYTDLEPDVINHVQQDGVDRLVVGQHSDFLHMTVYVSQDMELYNQEAGKLVRNYALVALGILSVTLVFVVIISLGLTRAIRKLTRRVEHLPVDSVLAHTDEALTATVTNPGDAEIHQLETTLNHLMGKLQASMHSEIAMREGALQAQLNALQMQINPHFIYNTLNIISAKGMECGSEEIMDICDQFAQMLRYAADLRTKMASLGDELGNARRYLQLVKARYEDQLTYHIDVPESMYALTMPKLTLQPIIENAVTHGFAGRTDPREVRITGRVDNGQLKLILRDNGNGFSEEALLRLRHAFADMEAAPTAFSAVGGEHLGLINTYLRLLHASNGRIRMTLHNDAGAVITLTLPVEQELTHV